MESSDNALMLTIRMDKEGKVYIEFPDDGVDITLPDMLFLLRIAEQQILASYYSKINDGEQILKDS